MLVDMSCAKILLIKSAFISWGDVFEVHCIPERGQVGEQPVAECTNFQLRVVELNLSHSRNSLSCNYLEVDLHSAQD